MSKKYTYKEMEGDFVGECIPQRGGMAAISSADYNPALMHNSFKQECLASVREAEEEYGRTHEAIDFEDMMAGFKEEFKW